MDRPRSCAKKRSRIGGARVPRGRALCERREEGCPKRWSGVRGGFWGVKLVNINKLVGQVVFFVNVAAAV
jgi:hypothetical protein